MAKTSEEAGQTKQDSELESSKRFSDLDSSDSDDSHKEATKELPHKRIIRLVITFIKNFFY